MTTKELLRRDKRTHQLVDVVERDKKIVFFEPNRWSLHATPFNESGVDGNQKLQWEKIKERTDVEWWVREKGEEFWTWVHAVSVGIRFSRGLNRASKT